jgi:hypothetical protein
MPALELPPILVDELVELDAGEDNEGVILVNEEINLMTLFFILLSTFKRYFT